MNATSDARIPGIAYLTGVSLLLFVATTGVVASVGFLLGIPIGIYTAPLSAVFSLATIAALQFCARQPLSTALVAGLLSFALVIVFVIAACGVYDISYDGNSYQKVALGNLAHGWNPVFESADDFYARAPHELYPITHAIWVDHYPKATWLYGASVYALTQSIEAAKSLNLLCMAAVALLVFDLLRSIGLGKLPSSIVALLAAVNPITLAQVATNYVDGVLMCVLLAAITELIRKSRHASEAGSRISYMSLASTIVIGANIKFTGLVYLAFFCASFLILELVRMLRKHQVDSRFILRELLFYAVTLVIALCLVGSSSYVRNLIDHGNPFYPLMGSETADVISNNQPVEFADENPYVKYVESLFSVTRDDAREPIDLKAPFTWSDEELVIHAVDTRRAGFGFLFSRIFLISIVVLAVCTPILARRGRPHFIGVLLALFIPCVLLVGLADGSWWARYSIYMYLFPLAALVCIFAITQARTPAASDHPTSRTSQMLPDRSNSVGQHFLEPADSFALSPSAPGSHGASSPTLHLISLIAGIFLAVTLAINTASFRGNLQDSIQFSGDISETLQALASSGITYDCSLADGSFGGVLYNLIDTDISYRVHPRPIEEGRETISVPVFMLELAASPDSTSAGNGAS